MGALCNQCDKTKWTGLLCEKRMIYFRMLILNIFVMIRQHIFSLCGHADFITLFLQPFVRLGAVEAHAPAPGSAHATLAGRATVVINVQAASVAQIASIVSCYFVIII